MFVCYQNLSWVVWYTVYAYHGAITHFSSYCSFSSICNCVPSFADEAAAAKYSFQFHFEHMVMTSTEVLTAGSYEDLEHSKYYTLNPSFGRRLPLDNRDTTFLLNILTPTVSVKICIARVTSLAQKVGHATKRKSRHWTLSRRKLYWGIRQQNMLKFSLFASIIVQKTLLLLRHFDFDQLLDYRMVN